MPGLVSLHENQYYAHPRNAFWWIMGQMLNFDEGLPYRRRVEQLEASGYAVWDVLYDCVRAGSLDANIVRESEQANDLAGFAAANPQLRLIAFNGRAAQQLFMRHCGDVLTANTHIDTVLLPSSSPAYASLGRLEKLKLWRRGLDSG